MKKSTFLCIAIRNAVQHHCLFPTKGGVIKGVVTDETNALLLV